jgi:diacylglycerol kinase (ATP)
MIAVAIILNGISRRKKEFYRNIYPALTAKFSIEILETQWAGHARELAMRVAGGPYDFILAAGGDGTLNQVVNGVLLNETPSSLRGIGLIPLGTGNDFARTCKLRADAHQLISLLEASQPLPTDVGKIMCCDVSGKMFAQFFINVCSLGMGPEVVKRVPKSSRSIGPSFTYLKAIITTFLMHSPQHVHCKTPTWEWQGKVRVLALANGQSFGHGLYVAPDAICDDGEFNSFVAGNFPLWKFLFYLQTIKAKRKIKNERVLYKKISNAKLSSPDPCEIETDGEWVGYLPAEIEVLPKTINFLR